MKSEGLQLDANLEDEDVQVGFFEHYYKCAVHYTVLPVYCILN